MRWLLLLFIIAPAFALELNLNALPGKPNVWYCDRVLLKDPGAFVPPNVMKAFFDPDANLYALGTPTSPVPVEYSCRPDVGRCFHGGKVCFRYAVEGDGWRIQWGMYYCDGGDVNAQCERPRTCAIYLTGIGCPHCALTDPYLFYSLVPKNPVVLIEYEIYKHARENAEVVDRIVREFNTIPGVPQLILEGNVIVGDEPILQEAESALTSSKGCPLPSLPEKSGSAFWPYLLLLILVAIGAFLLLRK